MRTSSRIQEEPARFWTRALILILLLLSKVTSHNSSSSNFQEDTVEEGTGCFVSHHTLLESSSIAKDGYDSIKNREKNPEVATISKGGFCNFWKSHSRQLLSKLKQKHNHLQPLLSTSLKTIHASAKNTEVVIEFLTTRGLRSKWSKGFPVFHNYATGFINCQILVNVIRASFSSFLYGHHIGPVNEHLENKSCSLCRYNGHMASLKGANYSQIGLSCRQNEYGSNAAVLSLWSCRS
ncbi:hypothetical protein VNO77_02344 [Canavalia gladiata]|uniref:Uncharacterized protein n=1 Tax=Canavalia gladiata TaxID=3824 RepID=A0AAN9MTG9_CANGL